MEPVTPSGMRRGGGSGRGKTRLRVRIKRYHGVARWTWNTAGRSGGDSAASSSGADEEDEVCGICQSAFEGVAPGVKYPGDECPVVWGQCGHSFHLQCVSTWLQGRSTCPICRRDWEFGAESAVEDDREREGDGGGGAGSGGGEDREAEL